MQVKKINTPLGQVQVREAGEGPPLLCIHGVLSSSMSFRALLAEPGDRRVVALDLPGHGESTPSERFTPGWKSYADVVDGVAGDLGFETFDLMGHSMGGGIAAYYAGTRPERLRRLVLSDALTGPFKRPLKTNIPRIPLLGDYVFLKVYGEDMFFEYFESDVFHDPSLIDREQLHEYYLAFDRNRTTTLKAVRATANPKLVAKQLPRITCPTLVMWGECDPLIPMSVGADTHRVLKDSKFAVIPDCGHSPFEERPAKARETVLNFLNS